MTSTASDEIIHEFFPTIRPPQTYHLSMVFVIICKNNNLLFLHLGHFTSSTFSKLFFFLMFTLFNIFSKYL